jgi:hypothetical protein
MPRLRFEPTILVLERAKTGHVLDHTAIVIGRWCVLNVIYNGICENKKNVKISLLQAVEVPRVARG